ncbi:MAG: PfkB family carbohydrate kinase [bacterium]|nr:PfkB family carbohydrate kinase [bacterium]
MRLGEVCGAQTIFNPAPAHDLSTCDLSCAHIITPNETETVVCAGMSGDDLVTAMRRLQALGCRAVVTTQDAAGRCGYKSMSMLPVSVPTWPLIAVDTVGAGDAFTGGLSGWSCGKHGVGGGIAPRARGGYALAHQARHDPLLSLA